MLPRTFVILAAALSVTASPLLGGLLGGLLGDSSSSTSGTTSGSSSRTSGTTSGSTCNTGPVQCCNQVQPANSVDFSKILPSGLLSILPVDIEDLDIPVGLDCDPISVLGIGSNSCTQQTVCCQNNNFSGLVALGCTPINLSL